MSSGAEGDSRVVVVEEKQASPAATVAAAGNATNPVTSCRWPEFAARAAFAAGDQAVVCNKKARVQQTVNI